jgi:hypothetical protein
VLNIDDPPVLDPNPQVFNISENAVGTLGAVTYYDPDGDVASFSIIGGNDALLFRIDFLTGTLVASKPLNFEDQSLYPLLVQVSQISNRNLIGTGFINVQVLDANDPPTVSSSLVAQDESVVGAPGLFITRISAYDVDDNVDHLEWSSLTFSIAVNAYNGSIPLFSINSADGSLFLNAPLQYSYDDSFQWISGLRARAVYSANVSVCDGGSPPMCTIAVTSMIVVANYSAPLKPQILAYDAPVTGFFTRGGELITFTGVDFGFGHRVNASYCAGKRCYNATGCVVVTSQMITCRTAPGWGTDLMWTVTQDGILIPSVVVSTKYAAPKIDNVQLQSGAITTNGGAIFNISGSNFGPNDTTIDIRYGLNQEFAMERIFANHEYITARLQQGCGANLPVSVRVGVQSSLSTNLALTSFSFPPPGIKGLTVGAPDYTLSSLSTIGGDIIVITGTNFGPFDVPVGSGTLLAPSVVYAGGPNGQLGYEAVGCTKTVSTTHTRITCLTAPGAGTNFAWKVQVCGQWSSPSTATTAFSPPVITSVSGTGKTGASTEGGQQLSIFGTNLGYIAFASSEAAIVVTSVQYGPYPHLGFVADSCRVIDASRAGCRIDCLTSQGTGFNHSLQANIAGQVSNVFTSAVSYGEPVISLFDRAIYAQTPGGDVLLINGTNFGFDISLVNVTYTAQMLDQRAIDGLVPGSPPGLAKYKPANCSFVVPHRSIACAYEAGGGKKLVWDMVVDGQQSASPTTNYYPPTITGVELLDGATLASTRGGTRIRVTGLNFGLPHLIQAVRYGVTGREYVARNFTYISHYELIVTLSPGIGSNLRFTIEVADQLSDASTAMFSYATPFIVSVSPGTGITYYDPARPVLMKVSGYEFGLLDSTADVAVVFGHAADGTLTGMLPVVARYPAADAVVSGTFVPPLDPYLEWVTFVLPESLGANRTVRVVPYRRGQRPTTKDILGIPIAGQTNVFTFKDPFISQVSPNAISPGNETDLVRSLFANVVDLADYRRLVISPPMPPQAEVDLRSFGPPQLTDSVQRIIEFKQVVNGQVLWESDDVRIASWNHSQIVAFSRLSAATMRLRIVAADAIGAPVTQVSNEYSFSRLSPQVFGLVGALDGYPTTGGDHLQFKAGGLATTQELNVTVGGRNAQLLDSAGQLVSALEAKDRIVLTQGRPQYPPYPDDFQWTINIIIPPGEGREQSVQLVRDGLYSQDSSAMSIDYLPPVFSAFSVWSAVSGSSPVQPWVPTVPIVVPTHDASIKLIGANFGLCPLLQFMSSNSLSIDACPTDPLSGRRTSNPLINRTHTEIEVRVPQGEGAGLPTSWYISLMVKDQYPAAGLLAFRYAPPSVDSISPSVGPTTGNFTVTIRGDNFGALSLPAVWIGSDSAGFLPCASVARLSHTDLTCIMPEGSGMGMQARVFLYDQSGQGGNFAYLPPSIANVTVTQLSAGPYPAGYNGSIAAVWINKSTPYGAGGSLQGDTLGGYVITLTGDNFGPRKAGRNCVFSVWSRYLLEPASLECNGLEDFNGEGEIASWNIISWTHTSIMFSLPPGMGDRKFVVSAGGQFPVATSSGASVLDFHYHTPSLTEPFTVAGQRSTEGGDVITLRGLSLPPAVYRNLGSSVVSFPLPLGNLNGSRVMLPLQHVVVTFGARCITNALDAQGRVPVGIDRLNCLNTGDMLFTSHRSWYGGQDAYGFGLNFSSPVQFGAWDVDQLAFRTPTGIGVNKSVSVRIYDYSAISHEYVQIAKSNAMNFTYAAPNITFVDPSPLYVLGLSSDNVVLIGGENFGRYQDRAFWSEEEQLVQVHTGGIPCNNAERIVRKGLDMIQCVLNSATVTVGFKNMTVMVAGQLGYLPDTNPQTLQIVCGKEFFGHQNETCMACPIGAVCSGYLVGYGRDRPIGLIGNVEHDGTGLHTYPVPMSGFYNLNGTESEPCPPMKLIPGRDVCVVACVPLEACLGDNICAPAYASKAPNYR